MSVRQLGPCAAVFESLRNDAVADLHLASLFIAQRSLRGNARRQLLAKVLARGALEGRNIADEESCSDESQSTGAVSKGVCSDETPEDAPLTGSGLCASQPAIVTERTSPDTPRAVVRELPSAAASINDARCGLKARRALSVQIRLPEEIVATIVSSGRGTPVGVEFRTSHAAQDSKLLVRLPTTSKVWQVPLPFLVDSDDPSTVVRLSRKQGTLTIHNLLEADMNPCEDNPSDVHETPQKSAVDGCESLGGAAHGGRECPETSHQDSTDEQMCRYCFAGIEEGPLISPCRCSGGQKFVHLHCLRRWQRSVVVSQPTHPLSWQDESRHHRCNVCLSEFSCAPPSRQELMESFTGPKIAALVEEGCIIGAHDAFSGELEARMMSMSDFTRELSSYQHWVRGIYLITEVSEDRAQEVFFPIPEQSMLEAIRSRISRPELTFDVQGQRYRLVPGGDLAGVTSQADLPDALAALTAPATLLLLPVAVADYDSGEDVVCAVNLTRPEVSLSAWRRRLAEAARSAAGRSLLDVVVSHFLGGPCDSENLSCCVVLGGPGSGSFVAGSLQEAFRVIAAWQAEQRLVSGQLPAILAFWGNAQWSRAQLLGEIARGHWGLCQSSSEDLRFYSQPSELRARIYGRLAFAPVSEMTEEFMREALRQVSDAPVQNTQSVELGH